MSDKNVADIRKRTFAEQVFHIAVNVGGYKGELPESAEDLRLLEAWVRKNLEDYFNLVVPGLVQAIGGNSPIDAEGVQGGFLVIPKFKQFAPDVALGFDFNDDDFGTTFISVKAYHRDKDQRKPVDLPKFLAPASKEEKGS